MANKYHNIDGTVKPIFQIGARNPRIIQMSSEPPAPLAYDIWINAESQQILFRNSANTAWLELSLLDNATKTYVDNAVAEAGGASDFDTLVGFNKSTTSGTTTVTSDSWTNGPGLTFTAPEAGLYHIGVRFNYNCSDSSTMSYWRVTLDGTEFVQIRANNDSVITGDYLSTGSAHALHFADFTAKSLSAGSHTIQTQLYTTTSGNKASIWGCELFAWRIN